MKLHRPYRQGSLDGLCGFYSVINAIRCIVRHDEESLTIVQDELPKVLVDEMSRRRQFKDSFFYGIGTPEVAGLLERSVDFLEKRWISIAFSRPLLSVTKPTISQSVGVLKKELEEGHSVLLLGLGGHHDHWSVGCRITNKFITTYDSAGITRVSIDHCRMTYEPRLGKLEHVFGRGSVFAVSLLEGRHSGW